MVSGASTMTTPSLVVKNMAWYAESVTQYRSPAIWPTKYPWALSGGPSALLGIGA